MLEKIIKEFSNQVIDMNYDVKCTSYLKGDFGTLERIEFDSHELGGFIDYWGNGYLNVHLVNYKLEKEILNRFIISNIEEDKIKLLYDLLEFIRSV